MASRTDLELLRTQVANLFRWTAAGDLVDTNEHPGVRGPRAFLGRTREGDLLSFRDDLDEAARAHVRAWAADLPRFAGKPTTSATNGLRDALGGGEGAYAGPAYLFTRPLFAMGAMLIYPSQAASLHPELIEWAAELRDRRPCYGVFHQGQAVAICCCARSGPDAADAGVETVAAFRGRGFAAMAVEAWATDIRGKGRIPFYSTSWENTASQAVAGKLGLTLYAEHIHVT